MSETTGARTTAQDSSATPRTLAEKVWTDHLVRQGENGQPDLIYIDLHLVHEVTSPRPSRVCAWPAVACVAPI